METEKFLKKLHYDLRDMKDSIDYLLEYGNDPKSETFKEEMSFLHHKSWVYLMEIENGS